MLKSGSIFGQLYATAGVSSGFRLFEKAGASANDYLDISVVEHGVTTISTVDGAASAANLTMDVDGDIILDPTSGVTKFLKDGDADDLCTLTVAANGATTIATADSDGAVGHLTLDVDGDINLNADGGQVRIKAVSYTHLTLPTILRV